MRRAALTGAFADPSRDAAHAFRAILSAMARPGRIERVQGATPPAPLSVAAGVALLTLLDPETPVFLGARHDTEALRDWIAFHCGAPVTDRARARFAIGTWRDLTPLDAYAIGTAEYPDRSATLIVELDELRAEGATLTGPGIKETAALSLPETALFQHNSALFPLGLDFLFTCADRIAGLPRTTRVAR